MTDPILLIFDAAIERRKQMTILAFCIGFSCGIVLGFIAAAMLRGAMP